MAHTITRINICLVLCVVSACGSTVPRRDVPAATLPIQWTPAGKRVLVDLDGVRLYERSEIGPGAAPGFSIFTVRDDWVESAHGMILRAVGDRLAEHGIQIVQKANARDSNCTNSPSEPVGDNDCARYIVQIAAADWYRNIGSKAGNVLVGVWTLGLVPLITAFPPEPGSPLANALARAEKNPTISIIDISDRKIVWSQVLPGSRGDLRTESGARRTVEELFQGAPL